MKDWKSVDDVLDFAINAEIEAAAFYTKLAKNAEKAWMKEVFEGFAKEEEGHRAKLEAVKSGKMMLKAGEKVADLRIGDYIPKVKAEGDDVSYEDALIIAMHAEKAAFKLYSDIAKNVEDETLKETFLALAQEEAKHKLRFEVEYDEYALTQN